MGDLLKELKRRNVFRVSVAYVVIAWLIAQVAELALDSFEAPTWVIKTLLLLLALGFPLALFFAWAFEITPDGVKREREVDRSQSVTRGTGRKLDFVIIGVLAVALTYFAVDKFVIQPEATSVATGIAPAQEVGSDEKSIAVLPFVDMSPSKDQEYFTDGLTENLLHALAQISEIKVTGRTSSFAFKGLNQDLREIGEQLNVRNILEGSVQKAGNRVRITAQLVNTHDGFHLWSETFDRNLNDIFAVQDEITMAVVKALRKSILGDEEIQSGYSGNFEAYNAYLQGQFFGSQQNPESWDGAIEQYRSAIELDPGMALAWAGLSESIARKTGFDSDQDFAKGYEQARAAAAKAIALDPELPEAYLAMAGVQLSHDWDWAAVERSLRRALELRPGDPDIRAELAGLMSIRGDVSAALVQFEQALSQDPLNVPIQRQRVWALISLGRLDEALAACKSLIARYPDHATLGIMLAVVYKERGEYELSLEAAATEKLSFLRLTAEAMSHYALGNKEIAEQKLEQLKKEHGENVSYQVAAIYADWGDSDHAFEALERGYAIRDPGLIYIQMHSAFNSIRQDPRYEILLKKMGLKE